MKSEILLLTKSYNLLDLEEWLHWHLETCKFSKIHIVDNDSSIDIPKLIRNFSKSITYEHVSGAVRQYRIYDKYINFYSNSDWIMPIDDDEYFWFDPSKFSSIEEVVSAYSKKFPTLEMLAIRWKMMYPENFFKSRLDSQLKHCYKESYPFPIYPVSHNITIKTLVKRDGFVHYQETWENPKGGHIPCHSKSRYALFYDGTKIFGSNRVKHLKNFNDPKEDIRILHCKVKSYEEFKNNLHPLISDKNLKPFDQNLQILKNLEAIKQR